MKKILSALLIAVSLLSLFSCGEKYKPVESTAEEAKTVMTLSIDGKEYEIKYELYRALFLNYKSTVDGGDDSVWTGEEKTKYIDEINGIITARASELFAVIHLADTLGFKPYSQEVENEISELIRLSIEGNGSDIIGFGGDYGAYLASLKEMNLNYSTQVLLLRYVLMLEKINEYYIGIEDPALGLINGNHEFSKEDVKAFYDSDECVRILQAFVSDKKLLDSKERIESLREDILKASDEKSIALLIINNTSATPTDLIVNKEVSGIVFGRDTISENFYAEYRDSVFALAPGEVSEVIKVGGADSGYYLAYVLEKNDEHFETFYDDIKIAYLDNFIGAKFAEIGKKLTEGVSYEDGYSEIEHGNISMN